MSKSIGVAEVKRNFSEVLTEVNREGKHFIIERKGKPVAAMVNIKDLEALEGSGKKGRIGLLAAIGAWEDFTGLEKAVSHIYKKRRTAKDRFEDCVDCLAQ